MSRALSRFIPRDFLARPELFGVDPTAQWRPVRGLVPASQLALAHWQHLAACVINERLKSSGYSRGELAKALGVSVTTFRRKLTGAFPAPAEELFRWALALDDVSVLPPPANSASDILPEPGRGTHRYKKLDTRF